MLHQPITAAPAALTGRWCDDPRAVALLAACAVTPPPTERIPSEHRWTIRSRTYTGPLVEGLEAIRREYGDAAGDDNAAFLVWAETPEIDDLIDLALATEFDPAALTDAVYVAAGGVL